MAANPTWSREEVILALDLYHRLDGKVPDVKHPEVAALAALLANLAILSENKEGHAGRSKASIIFKLSNLRSLDPKQKARNLLGFPNVGKIDKAVWKEFDGKIKQLRQEALKIVEKILSTKVEYEPLKANIHLLRLVGDQLVGSLYLAVFELVKNSYDADAQSANVVLDLESDSPSIVVSDNGCGMDMETIRYGWLQLGGGQKRGKDRNQRTEDFHRLPLGEKGIGRLAAFKLGDTVELVTRAKGEDLEYSVKIDLSEILEETEDSQVSIEDVRIKIHSSIPTMFTGKNKKGTWIKVSKLRHDPPWDKRQVRALHRLIHTLVNPFNTKKDAFSATLDLPGREGWVGGLLTMEDILQRAIYKYKFEINDEAELRWSYEFLPPPAFKTLNARLVDRYWGGGDFVRLDLEAPDIEEDEYRQGRIPKQILLSPEQLSGIGPLSGELYVFDRRPSVLKKQGGEPKQVASFLNEQTGVRVYRDDIRVYSYGEGEDDWLRLNQQRVNKPGRHLATNAVIASIELQTEFSTGLVEKTNREGFDENACFLGFRRIVSSIIDQFNRARLSDRKKLDDAVKKVPSTDPEGRFTATAEEIRKISKEKGFEAEIAPKIDSVIREYRSLQEAALGAAAGLNLAVIFHEAERELKGVIDSINREEDISLIKKKANHVASLIEGFSGLYKKTDKPRVVDVSKFLENVSDLTSGRFKAHKVVFSCPVITGEDEDFKISGSLNYYLSAVTNIINNSIYWTSRKREEVGGTYQPAISIRTVTDWAAEGPAVAIIDNGDGFTIEPELAVRPFISDRAGGMGLGLFFANLVMETHGGSLHVVDSAEDLGIETPHDGAVVVLRFRSIK